jgi:hypothetical protein
MGEKRGILCDKMERMVRKRQWNILRESPKCCLKVRVLSESHETLITILGAPTNIQSEHLSTSSQ